MTYLGLFGSFSRGEQTKNIDIDFLVRFSEKKSLLDHIRMENELENLFGTKVDMVTEKSLSPYIIPHVQENLQNLYHKDNSNFLHFVKNLLNHRLHHLYHCLPDSNHHAGLPDDTYLK
ncbi:nucleotidyltransferase family protein [Methanohalophilus sp.]